MSPLDRFAVLAEGALAYPLTSGHAGAAAMRLLPLLALLPLPTARDPHPVRSFAYPGSVYGA